MKKELESRFKDLWTRLEAKGDYLPVFNRFVVSYSEPHRYYHGLKHLEHCLVEFDEVRHLYANPEAIEFAFWGHNLVHDTHRQDNEEISALDAVQILQKYRVSRVIQKDVWRLILITAHNVLPQQADEKVVVDIDLSIFGQPAEEFNRYERQIRKEYSHISEVVFRRERANILQKFLSRRENLFSTKEFREKYGEQALVNLQRTITLLDLSAKFNF